MIKILQIIFLTIFLQLNVFAEEFNSDLSLSAENTFFSTNDPIVNQKLRIYATIENKSDQDLFWYVRFYDESLKKQIWKNEEISIIAWKSDDVFVDWIIQWYWEHVISARVVPQKKSWDNPANNKVTKKIFVDFDSDWDWIPNRKDSDDDNDWIYDVDDAFPHNSRESSDCDWDWIWDNADLDDDNDWVKDDNDVFKCDPKEWDDTDQDWIWDNLDQDDDNDWLLDIEEKNTDSKKWDSDWDWINDKDDLFPNDKKRWIDTDWDWISNFDDADNDNDGVNDVDDIFPLDPKEQYDTDKDWIWNNADDDNDNDWWSDKKEFNTWTNPLKKDSDWDWYIDPSDVFPLDPKEWADNDKDLIWDNADKNDDNDDFEDNKDIFPLNPKERADCDKDWIWDNADDDDDNDGIKDINDAFVCNANEWKDSDWDWIWDNEDKFDFNKAPKAEITFSPKDNVKVWDIVHFKAITNDDDWEVVDVFWKINWEKISWNEIDYKFEKEWYFAIQCFVKDDVWEETKKEEFIFVKKNNFIEKFLLWILIFFAILFIFSLRKKWFKIKKFK